MIRPRSSREPSLGTSKSKKKQGWEALSHNAPHILRELQLHFKVSTSRLIFIFFTITPENVRFLLRQGEINVNRSCMRKVKIDPRQNKTT